MCGISGAISLSGQIVNPEQVSLMHAQIPSRGPDGEGFFRSHHICLAHRRLSIIDLVPESDQPFHLNDRYVLYFQR